MSATAENPPIDVKTMGSITTISLPDKKPFHRIAEEYVGCLLAEINAYQIRERAWQQLTTGQIPDRDLKNARGATNSMQEVYRVRLAEEVAGK